MRQVHKCHLDYWNMLTRSGVGDPLFVQPCRSQHVPNACSMSALANVTFTLVRLILVPSSGMLPSCNPHLNPYDPPLGTDPSDNVRSRTAKVQAVAEGETSEITIDIKIVSENHRHLNCRNNQRGGYCKLTFAHVFQARRCLQCMF